MSSDPIKKMKFVKGGALYYALFVMIVLSALSLLLISFFELSLREDLHFYKQTELDNNIESAIVKLECDPGLLKPGVASELDVFDNGESMVTSECQRWGALLKIVLHANWKNISSSKCILTAELEEKPLALWMPDYKEYVSLAGKSYVNGNCYLSDLGFRRGNADGKHFEGPYLHKGQLLESNEKMVPLKTQLKDYIAGYLSNSLGPNDSLVPYLSVQNNPNINQSFYKETLVLHSPAKMNLTSGTFENNIIIASDDTITIFPEVKLNNVILFAPVIVFKTGFEGTLQAFAHESIIVEDHCRFQYPSFLGCVGQSPDITVQIGESCKVNGGVFCFSENNRKGKTYVSIGRDTEMTGKIYVNGDLRLKTNVTGTVYCEQFVYMTPQAYYENFLVDCFIDNGKLPVDYATFCVDDNIYKLREVQSCE